MCYLQDVMYKLTFSEDNRSLLENAWKVDRNMKMKPIRWSNIFVG